MGVALLLAVPVSTHADPQDLTGGALITHYHPDYWGFRYPSDECSRYYDVGPITACEEQNTTIEVSGEENVLWFVVAAFDEDKEWCGIQFGFGDYNPDILYFFYAAPCYPSHGLEIRSDGWPGPNEGTSFVTTDEPWTGNFVHVYYFTATVYGDYGPDLIQLIPDPTVVTPFGGFVNCTVPPETFDAALGGMGINQPGTYVCWGWESSVCCIGEECVLVLQEEECLNLGGEFHSEWDSCGPPNPCEMTPSTTTSWGTIKTLYR